MSSLSLILRRRSTRITKSRGLLSHRHYSNASATVASSRLQDPAVQRELFVNVLNANVTKRDAKEFIATFEPFKPATNEDAEVRYSVLQQERYARLIDSQQHLNHIRINAERQSSLKNYTTLSQHKMQLALVCFKSPETVDDTTIDGFAITLSQLVKLGMQMIIVLDSNVSGDVFVEGAINNVKTHRGIFAKQAERLCQAIEKHIPEGAQSIPSAFEWVKPDLEAKLARDSSPIAIAIPGQLLDPLKRGSVLVLPSMAYTSSGQLLSASSKDVMAGLTRQFAPAILSKASVSSQIEIKRVIIVDPIGGIPSKERSNNAYGVFNLEQHFDDFEKGLSEYKVATDMKAVCTGEEDIHKQHVNNLDTIRKCLQSLPPTSSGLILTPAEAANSILTKTSEKVATGNETRQKNLLIHNILTNKPIVSPSLPTARLSSGRNGAGHKSKAALSTSTVVKRGMPLAIIPAERTNGWKIPTNGTTRMKLEDDPRIDFPRLMHLINNSFGRVLDVNDYLARTKNRIAGVIVAGEYEGGAIFTWEMPPNTQDPARVVPYLDKFAVLKSSQGSNGVADILFKAMVESCFPDGVCWRSRKSNPVNKWYFERSAGSWQIPISNWTAFWTGEIVIADERWKDYVEVCKSVRQSWTDTKKLA